jgi:hypothetical protein
VVKAILEKEGENGHGAVSGKRKKQNQTNGSR